MTEVRLVNLVKKFDKTVAVDGINLDVRGGEFVVLLGPSGCGKTTTLRCIAGLEAPDAGDIIIEGNRVNELSPKERDVAMVFQNYALYPHMSVYDNMAFPLKMRKLSRGDIETRVNEAARLLNIQHLLTRKPRQLSGGEQQRVALGRAIVRRPRVFLMDEPLSNLDAKLRLFMRAELKKLQKDLKVTTVYVTHDQAEAMAMADKVAVMNQGKLEQYDTPSAIYARPRSTFVAGFIGSPPMNLMKASLLESDGQMVVDGGFFKYTLRKDLSDIVKQTFSGTEVLLGVRPEDLHIYPTHTPDSVFEADVYVVEPMGPNMVVDLKIGDYLLKSVTPSLLHLSTGQRIWVGFSPDRIHLFDAKGETAII